VIFFRSADYLIFWMSCLLIQTVRLRLSDPVLSARAQKISRPFPPYFARISCQAIYPK